MVTAMDEAIGNVTETLKKKGIFNDTLIIFTADVSIFNWILNSLCCICVYQEHSYKCIDY